MQPLIFNLGPTELIIILVIVLLLFGGSRLAGLGKSSGRALKEFKEETRGLRDTKDESAQNQLPPAAPGQQPPANPAQHDQTYPSPGYSSQPQGSGQPSADRDLRRDV